MTVNRFENGWPKVPFGFFFVKEVLADETRVELWHGAVDPYDSTERVDWNSVSHEDTNTREAYLNSVYFRASMLAEKAWDMVQRSKWLEETFK